jgi:hypothetical protein
MPGLVSLALAAALAAPAPSLRIDTAVYDLNSGVLQFAFTFANPSDSTLYLDCQLPPRAALQGDALILTFARGGAAEGARAGGPAPTDSAPAAAVDPEAFPPQRIAGGQSFQGQRRLDRVLGDPNARPRFSSIKLKMDYYPERAEGEGPMYVAERAARAESAPHKAVRKGKPPAPPKVIRLRRPVP